MKFEVVKRDISTSARSGIISTGHGAIETPVFMPVGTAGTVKAVHQRELRDDLNAKIILGNTYHLYLRPGIEIIRQAGGLHRFMNWDRPILTDSGGYQVFSLANIRKLTEEGAMFSSHIDGSKHMFTPESIVEIQRAIGADIIMALDECTTWPSDHKTAKKSLDLTHQWLARGAGHFERTEPLYGHEQDFFPIVQGSVYKDLREASAHEICSYPAGGYAIGGLSVGEPAEVMYEMVDAVTNILPADKPRYLMGVGTPVNLLESIALGIDMFDCVIPTRNGRNGMLFSRNGIMNMRNNKWKDDFTALDPDGTCFVDRQYSKAYLRHLIISKEILGAQIASLHNLSFYLWLMEESGKKIREGRFGKWKNEMISRLSQRI
ncbi:MAG TPA: tRNA guanosine(34) transglycosylase Tgt [Bacteroidales bacterium]|nr:tRNA guanosine(34) transglycosylase Tgt [Bacteroidales bacterium]